MDRRSILDLLNCYTTSFPEEKNFVPRFISLINNFPGCFSRDLLSGHITGSAWVISFDKRKVVLLHHKKLNRWLQPGGHADGEENLRLVAGKELEEETGLKNFRWLNNNIFDLDIHIIPARSDVRAHFHFDVRFIAEADPADLLINNKESNAVQWLNLDEAGEKSNFEPSIERMIVKTRMLQ